MTQAQHDAAPITTGTNQTASVFSFDVRPDKIGIITINVPGEKVNTLKAEFVDQFLNVFKQAQQSSGLKGLILISGKSDTFIAGADISMIAGCKTKEDARDLAEKGQKLFSQIANYPLPVVAAIHGACLGAVWNWRLHVIGVYVHRMIKLVLDYRKFNLGYYPALVVLSGCQGLLVLVQRWISF